MSSSHSTFKSRPATGDRPTDGVPEPDDPSSAASATIKVPLKRKVNERPKLTIDRILDKNIGIQRIYREFPKFMTKVRRNLSSREKAQRGSSTRPRECIERMYLYQLLQAYALWGKQLVPGWDSGTVMEKLETYSSTRKVKEAISMIEFESFESDSMLSSTDWFRASASGISGVDDAPTPSSSSNFPVAFVTTAQYVAAQPISARARFAAEGMTEMPSLSAATSSAPEYFSASGGSPTPASSSAGNSFSASSGSSTESQTPMVLTAEQRARMDENRRRALERLQARQNAAGGSSRPGL